MLPNSYDSSLRDKLKATTKEGVVLNKHFEKWESSILESMECSITELMVNNWDRGFPDADEDDIIKYSIGEYEEMLNECKQHASDYNNDLTADNIITFVHPLFMNLRMMEQKIRGDVSIYFERYMNTLANHRFQKVLFASPHDYIAADSLLMGYYDIVFFTRYGSGLPLEDQDFSSINGKNLYVAGTANTACLPSFCQWVRNTFDIDKKIFALRDLILNPPIFKNQSILDPVDIYWGRGMGLQHFPESQIVTLKQLE